MKDCDENFLEDSLGGVENTPPVEAINDSMKDDYFEMLDEIKFPKTKLSEKDREINFFKARPWPNVECTEVYLSFFLKKARNPQNCESFF